MRTCLLAALLIAHPATMAAEEMQFVEKHITTYPFVATPERAVAITANYRRIRNGMTADQVESVLGVPDEVLPLYEPKIKNGKQIGHTYWYVLRRMQERGSMKERDESLVRVSFDSGGQVIRVDRW